MEHAYTLTVTPLDKLRFVANFSNINYKDYFYQVTTSALSLTNGLLNPKEDVLTLGGSIEYTPMKNLRIVVDYKNYDYEIAGPGAILRRQGDLLPAGILCGGTLLSPDGG